MPIAPYQVYLCPLYRDGTKVGETADKINDELEAAGLECCLTIEWNRRALSSMTPTAGIPLRVTISPRTLDKNSVEVKWRAEKESKLLPIEGLATVIKQMVAENYNYHWGHITQTGE